MPCGGSAKTVTAYDSRNKPGLYLLAVQNVARRAQYVRMSQATPSVIGCDSGGAVAILLNFYGCFEIDAVLRLPRTNVTNEDDNWLSIQH
jgi:hypothetical protein